MKVFISWSGDLSKRAADLLHEWLPFVVPTVSPYMSAKDIEMGERWSTDVAAELEAAAFGILCITRSNESEPWVNFEAGALSKALNQARVCPLLLDLRPAELDRRSPLLQFQAATVDAAQMLQLVHSLNRASEAPRPAEFLEKSFQKWWPELQANFDKAIRESRTHTATYVPEHPKSRVEVMLEELLELARNQVRSQSGAFKAAAARADLSPQTSLETHLPPTHIAKLREELARFEFLRDVDGSEGARQRQRTLRELQRHVTHLRRLTSVSTADEEVLATATALLEKNRLSPIEAFRTVSVPFASRPDLRALFHRTLQRAGGRSIAVDVAAADGQSRFTWSEGPSETEAAELATRVIEQRMNRSTTGTAGQTE